MLHEFLRAASSVQTEGQEMMELACEAHLDFPFLGVIHSMREGLGYFLTFLKTAKCLSFSPGWAGLNKTPDS